MTNCFDDTEEHLYRKVKNSLFQSSRDKVPDAAFDLRENRDEKGVSFDRADGRDEKECVKFMRKHLSGGKIISLTVGQAREAGDISIKHTPSDKNPYHSEIEYNTNDGMAIMKIKNKLARFSRIVSEGETYKNSR